MSFFDAFGMMFDPDDDPRRRNAAGTDDDPVILNVETDGDDASHRTPPPQRPAGPRITRQPERPRGNGRGSRILIGVVSGWLWIALKRVRVNDYIALPVVGVVGAMTNTVLVMGSIYFLLAQQYAEVKNVALDAVFGLVMATVTTAGIPEAIAAAVLVTAIGKALLRLTGTAPQRGLAGKSGAADL